MNKNAIEYEYGEILNYQTNTQYLFDIPTSKKGEHRKAACRCGYCGKVKIMEIRDAKKGRHCSRECAKDDAIQSKIKYCNGDTLNDIGSVLIKRIDGVFGIIQCGRCGKKYRGYISQVANNNLVCFECRTELSAQHRTVYKEGSVVVNKNGDSFLFYKELDSTRDSEGHPRRVGIFIPLEQDFGLKEPFEAQLSTLISGAITGKNFSKGARKIANVLDKMGIPYEQECTFDDLVGVDKNHRLKFDFKIPLSDRDVFLEYDGEQHYHPVAFFGGEESYRRLKKYDSLKDDYIRNRPNSVLYRIPYYDESKIDSYYIYGLLFERGEG